MEADFYQRKHVPHSKLTIDSLVEKTTFYLRPDQDIYQAMNLITKEKHCHAAPVLDEEKNLLGLLSEKDCLKHAFDAKYNSMPPGKVKDYMSKDLTVLSLGAELYEVIGLFIKNNFQAYPVMKGGLYYGLLKRSRVLEAVQKNRSRK
jgi:predicted transcriptional regulator